MWGLAALERGESDQPSSISNSLHTMATLRRSVEPWATSPSMSSCDSGNKTAESWKVRSPLLWGVGCRRGSDSAPRKVGGGSAGSRLDHGLLYRLFHCKALVEPEVGLDARHRLCQQRARA